MASLRFEVKERQRQAGIQSCLKTKKHDTLPERLTEAWLKANNISYEKQYRVSNITVADFFVPPNILLYTDGDFWHSEKRNKGRDLRQNAELIAKGFVVRRISETSINAGVPPFTPEEVKALQVSNEYQWVPFLKSV